MTPEKESEICMSCGACCSFFTVQCTKKDLEKLTEAQVVRKIIFFEKKVFMLGTERFKQRCQFLDGNVGEQVKCTIYEQRPQACRDFHIQLANDKINQRCNKARAHHNLTKIESN